MFSAANRRLLRTGTAAKFAFTRFPASHRVCITTSSTVLQAQNPSESKLAGSAKSENPAVQGDSPSHTSTAAHPSKLAKNVRLWSNRSASVFHARIDEFSQATRAELARIGKRVNELTGYNEIELLKKLVAENESRMRSIRDAARSAKKAYEESVARRSSSQRETNDLLQRKSSWNETDVLRFTELVRTDHSRELEEAHARVAASEADSNVERQFDELMRSILGRYHEEQVWSDKIRSLSTYGSLVALGLNLIVFVLALVLVEPWKRRRLLQSFEERVVLFNTENRRLVEARMDGLLLRQEKQEQQLTDILTSIPKMLRLPTPVETSQSGEDGYRTMPGEISSSSSSFISIPEAERRTLVTTAVGAAVGGMVGILWSLAYS